MLVGVPKEIKNNEYRVGLTTLSVKELVNNGHQVVVETNAGLGIGLTDEQYISAGAKIAATASEVFEKADMIVKVKEPQSQECAMLREDQILFTFLHLAPDPEQAKGLVKSKCVAIAYETVTDNFGGLPLLTPMSEVAGRMSIQVGAWMLEKRQSGAGILLGGVPGVQPANVLILGGGVVGVNAARMAVGMGASVTILDRNIRRLNELDSMFQGRLKTVYSTGAMVEKLITKADLVVGAVLVVGAAAPRLITRTMLKTMKPGSVLVDVAIDQGGCFETSKATTHADPYFEVDGIYHYCVANMPGAVARTSAFALNNATLPFTLALANKGYKRALTEDKHLMNGLNVCKGNITHKIVADALNMAYMDADSVLI